MGRLTTTMYGLATLAALLVLGCGTSHENDAGAAGVGAGAAGTAGAGGGAGAGSGGTGASGGAGGAGTGASGGAGGIGAVGGSAGSGGTGASGGNGGTGASGGSDCDCVVGSYVPVCGVDGVTYDAACGPDCVPVATQCMQQCPCPGSGPRCGRVTCQQTERCCDPCQGTCVDQQAKIACPADGQLNPVCAACAMDGESCTTTPCCTGSCCGGVPIPQGSEYCSDQGLCPVSDYKQKRDFRAVDERAVLDGVLSLPITQWRYKQDSSQARHIGPMAQDFKATFQVGASDTSIFPLDEAGVSLVAIKALHQELQALRLEVQELRRSCR